MVFFDDVPEWLGLSLYLGMGWVGLLSGYLLWRCCGSTCVRPLVWGGLAYTLGAVLDFVPFPDIIPGILGRHELFHVAILAGIGWHWRLIWSYRGRQHPLPSTRTGGRPPRRHSVAIHEAGQWPTAGADGREEEPMRRCRRTKRWLIFPILLPSNGNICLVSLPAFPLSIRQLVSSQ